ncbi:uncharacterized protein ACB058_017701 [Synchiropus picturatus]
MAAHTAMCVFLIWPLLCVLGCVVASANDYDGNYYGDNYDNEISLDQLEGAESTSPCQSVDLSRWEKLFITLEDSHMRQNMLLESLQTCCGGMMSLKTQVEQLVRRNHQVRHEEAACRRQVEQVALRMQQSVLELQDEQSERERRLNATLQKLLESVLREKKDDSDTLDETNTPSVLQAFPSVQAESSLLDLASVQKTLVTIATDLRKVQQQLNRVLDHTGTLMRDRGET